MCVFFHNNLWRIVDVGPFTFCLLAFLALWRLILLSFNLWPNLSQLEGEMWKFLHYSYLIYRIARHFEKSFTHWQKPRPLYSMYDRFLSSTRIYILMLIFACHFHQVLLLLQSLFKFDHYRDTRAFILDPCIQGILKNEHETKYIFVWEFLKNKIHSETFTYLCSWLM